MPFKNLRELGLELQQPDHKRGACEVDGLQSHLVRHAKLGGYGKHHPPQWRMMLIVRALQNHLPPRAVARDEPGLRLVEPWFVETHHRAHHDDIRREHDAVQTMRREPMPNCVASCSVVCGCYCCRTHVSCFPLRSKYARLLRDFAIIAWPRMDHGGSVIFHVAEPPLDIWAYHAPAVPAILRTRNVRRRASRTLHALAPSPTHPRT